ncbi:hypothetical protein EVAR_100123_1 [Eumeta japonica]|uniref:Uncharacterized protein n=1 Tax=Eumeta variegata TaxID=151549 RepID=A0A4C1ZHG5_EUMVA|nr:hypothetical protein EVAR_100123_1 [Eumeta japonica]
MRTVAPRRELIHVSLASTMTMITDFLVARATRNLLCAIAINSSDTRSSLISDPGVTLDYVADAVPYTQIKDSAGEKRNAVADQTALVVAYGIITKRTSTTRFSFHTEPFQCCVKRLIATKWAGVVKALEMSHYLCSDSLMASQGDAIQHRATIALLYRLQGVTSDRVTYVEVKIPHPQNTEVKLQPLRFGTGCLMAHDAPDSWLTRDRPKRVSDRFAVVSISKVPVVISFTLTHQRQHSVERSGCPSFSEVRQR